MARRDDPDPPVDSESDNPNRGADEGRSRADGGRGHIFSQLFSGAAGAAIAAIAAIVIAERSDKAQERTVTGPVRTVTQTITKHVRAGSDGVPCSGSRVRNDPPDEPNDLIAEAYGPMRSDEPVEAALEDFQDVDFFAFCVDRRATVRTRVQQVGCVAPADSFSSCERVELQLVDDDGRALKASEVNSDTTVGTLRATVPAGRYFVRIAEGQGFRYEVTVSGGDVPLRRTVP